MSEGLPAIPDIGDDALGKDLAQFHSPLVKGVDPPDDPLGEEAVFVEGDDGTQSGGGKGIGQEQVLGRLPGQTRKGNCASATPSARRSAVSLPKAMASAWAKRLAMSRSCWSWRGLRGRQKPIRSQGE